MNRQENGYDSKNPFVIAGFTWRRLVASISVAAGVNTIFAALIHLWMGGDVFPSLFELPLLLMVLIFYACGAITMTLAFAFPSLVLVALIDQTLDKVFSPKTFAGAAVGLAMLPLSWIFILSIAFGFYPSSDMYIYVLLIGGVAIGCLCGVWGASWKVELEASEKPKLQFDIRQVIGSMFWFAVLLVLDGGHFFWLMVAAIYLATVVTVLTIYRVFLSPQYRVRHEEPSSHLHD